MSKVQTMQRQLSPLRYPGGKAKIAPLIASIITDNNLHGGTYIEPFAGGASVALYLLLNRYVSKIHINDNDPAIASFWYALKYWTDEMCSLISSTPISIDEWKKQREIQKRKEEIPFTLELAFSTLFLNRTNRSGIIWAGPIGGQKQSGYWKLDCRFNKENLIKRIGKIAKFKDAIEVSQMDAIDLLSSYTTDQHDNTFIYLDPPYYVKGKGLYLNSYTYDDHKKLATIVSKLQTKWFVSYDNVPEILDLYSAYNHITYQLNYSVQRHIKGSEVVFWDDLKMPQQLIKQQLHTEVFVKLVP